MATSMQWPMHLDLAEDGHYYARETETPETLLEKHGSITSVGLVFMYPPVGWQRVNMGRELYEHSDAFRAAIDECSALSAPLLPQPLVQVLYPDPVDEPMYAEVIHRAEFAMPCLFAVEYALTALWVSRGARPHAVVDHSVGELVAAVSSHALELRAALPIACERGRRDTTAQ